MMASYAERVWAGLWAMHHKTKDALTFFSREKGDAPVQSPSGHSANQTVHDPRKKQGSGRTKWQNIGLLLGPLLFFAVLFGLSPEGMPKEALAVLASTIWIAVWWITEAIPIPATSLLPIVLFPLAGAGAEGITSAYADDTIFLFLGGFILAIAMEKWNLHKRIALNIILLVGTSTERIVLGFMIATGFLSMWTSNTATAMMMMPIGLAVISHLKESALGQNVEGNFGKAIMLGVAYSASIGGLGTLIGTPPNTIFAGVVKELYGVQISFAGWMLFGVPLAAILLFAVWFYLVKMAFPIKLKEIPGGKGVIQNEKNQLGTMSSEEISVLIVFILTALAWVTRTFIPFEFMDRVNDTLIAITGALALFILPSRRAREGKLLNWKDAKEIPWGILLLFGGGLAIAKGFKESGLAKWIGEQLTLLESVHFLIVILCVTALVLFLTEITSNTATATMMFPIMASLSHALNVHPYALMVAAGIAASCAFMLPVATPPNAIAFGSGHIKIKDMAKAGFWINIFCIFFISLLIYYYMPIAWGIDISVFPQELKQ